MELNCCYRTKVDSKAFAIPILTASHPVYSTKLLCSFSA